jgi:hypothetical protein
VLKSCSVEAATIRCVTVSLCGSVQPGAATSPTAGQANAAFASPSAALRAQSLLSLAAAAGAAMPTIPPLGVRVMVSTPPGLPTAQPVAASQPVGGSSDLGTDTGSARVSTRRSAAGSATTAGGNTVLGSLRPGRTIPDKMLSRPAQVGVNTACWGFHVWWEDASQSGARYPQGCWVFGWIENFARKTVSWLMGGCMHGALTKLYV